MPGLEQRPAAVYALLSMLRLPDVEPVANVRCR
jgi:hypothetical protein